MYSSYWSQRYWTWEGLGITGADVPPELKRDVTQQEVTSTSRTDASECVSVSSAPGDVSKASLPSACNPGPSTQTISDVKPASKQSEVVKAGWNPTNDPGTAKLKNMTSSSYVGHLLVGRAIIPGNEGLSLLKKKQEEIARNRKMRSDPAKPDDVTAATADSARTPVTSPLYINTQQVRVNGAGVTSQSSVSSQNSSVTAPHCKTSVYSASKPKPFRAVTRDADVTRTDEWLTRSVENGVFAGLGPSDVKSRTAPVSPAWGEVGTDVKEKQNREAGAEVCCMYMTHKTCVSLTQPSQTSCSARSSSTNFPCSLAAATLPSSDLCPHFSLDRISTCLRLSAPLQTFAPFFLSPLIVWSKYLAGRERFVLLQ